MGQPTLIIKTTVRLQKQVTVYVLRSRSILQKVITIFNTRDKDVKICLF